MEQREDDGPITDCCLTTSAIGDHGKEALCAECPFRVVQFEQVRFVPNESLLLTRVQIGPFMVGGILLTRDGPFSFSLSVESGGAIENFCHPGIIIAILDQMEPLWCKLSIDHFSRKDAV